MNYLLKLTGCNLFRCLHGCNKRRVLFLIHRAVEIIVRITLAIAGSGVDLGPDKGFCRNNRGNGIIEVEPFTHQTRKLLGQGIAGKRTRSDYHQPFRRQTGQFFTNQTNIGVGGYPFGYPGGEQVTINSQGTTSRNPGGISSLHDQGTTAPQLLLEQTDRITQICPPQGVGTDQFSQTFRGMGWRKTLRLHLIQAYLYAALCRLPGGLTTGQTGTDDGDGCHADV